MKYFILTWTARRNSKRHGGIWYALAADPVEAERRLRRYIHGRYPGHRIVVKVDGTLPA